MNDEIKIDEDSPDLSGDEVERAVKTVSPADLAHRLSQQVRSHPGWKLASHELRRRKPHLYWRNRMTSPDGEELVLIYVVDWLA